jgi:DNA-binding MarR family transcriptional regulator
MASTHVTTQAGALIRKGLVSKRPNSQDGRSVLLALTARGEKVMQSIAPLRREFNDAFFQGVSRNSLLVSQRMLERIASNTDQALPMLRAKGSKPAAPRPRRV